MINKDAFEMQAIVATAAVFTSENPVLRQGQVGYESDTGRFKIGNGRTNWTTLSYAAADKVHTHFVDDGTAIDAVAAAATLTSDGTAPADGDKVTIGTKVYTFKTALSTEPAVEGEVLIGASAAAALDNLKSAVNHEGTAGTDYTCAAAHPDVEATDNTDTTQKFVARVKGTAGNAIAVAETSDHLTWGSEVTAFSGGVDGTVGTKYDIKLSADGKTLYFAIANGTVADTGKWRCVPLSTGPNDVSLGQGGLKVKTYTGTVAVTAAASISAGLAIPSGVKLLGCQIRVDEALATGETWDAEWNDGATVLAIASAQAVALNTKVAAFYDENGAAAITDAETDIVIAPNGGGSFTAQGAFTVVAYTLEMTALEDVEAPEE